MTSRFLEVVDFWREAVKLNGLASKLMVISFLLDDLTILAGSADGKSAALNPLVHLSLWA